MIGQISVYSPFLNSYVQSLTTQQKMRASDVFNQVILAKQDLTSLLATLNNQFNLNTLSLNQMPEATMITSTDWQLNLRDIILRFNDQFSLANFIGLLLDTNKKMLSSQIMSLQTQLSALEKQALNYEFLAADGGTFNYAYLETFHDNLGQANPSWLVPDRDGSPFDPNLQVATILTNEGALVLPDNINNNQAITASILMTNTSGFITSDTGIINCLSQNSTIGWRQAISSPTPLKTTINSVFDGYTGAQAVLEFQLSQPTACTELQIQPLSASSIDLIKVILYSSSQDFVGTSITLPTTNINQITNIHFPMMDVQRFQLYINQSQYERNNLPADAQEQNYRQLYNQTNNNSTNIYNLHANSEPFESMPKIGMASSAAYDDDLTDILHTYQTKMGASYTWSQGSNIYHSSLLHLFSNWPGVFKTIFPQDVINPVSKNRPLLLASIGTSAVSPQVANPVIQSPTVAQPLNYEYILGLQYVGIGIDVPELKGMFVSNIIPSPGDMGEVKLKAVDYEYLDNTGTLDNPQLTSIEYSVTNVTNPANESDWIPILPINDTIITSERLFPNRAGTCLLRFWASPGEQLIIYKNGYVFNKYTHLYDNSNNFLTAVSLDVQSYNAHDILTALYTPALNPSLVDFTNKGFANAPLISAFDATGSGEGFVGTGGRNSIQLSNAPYIDASQIANSDYQPITVVLQDGTSVINLTNYATNNQPAFPTTGYYFIQSGNMLMFNQPIDQAFRVYYQYLQNNVCFRIVLRVNSMTFVSPKVTSVQIKAQTRMPNVVQQI